MAHELKQGTLLKERYVLAGRLGSGAFGEVWKAHDTLLGVDVAVKVYISLDEAGLAEFRHEYVTTMGLAHPALLTASHFDTWGSRPFLVMKYCEEGSSTALAGHINSVQLWRFVRDVASGLAYLHSLAEPIIHQDIKPDNILRDRSGAFLISDFGISTRMKSTMRKQSVTAVGAGAVAYMGPERFAANPRLEPASDIWSLGVCIYELATGELPFLGMGGGMQRSGAEIPHLPRQFAADLNAMMRWCLDATTDRRPSAADVEQYAAARLAGAPAPFDIPDTEDGMTPAADTDFDPRRTQRRTPGQTPGQIPGQSSGVAASGRTTARRNAGSAATTGNTATAGNSEGAGNASSGRGGKPPRPPRKKTSKSKGDHKDRPIAFISALIGALNIILWATLITCHRDPGPLSDLDSCADTTCEIEETVFMVDYIEETVEAAVEAIEAEPVDSA